MTKQQEEALIEQEQADRAAVNKTLVANASLHSASTAALIGEVLERGAILRESSEILAKNQQRIQKAIADFDNVVEASYKSCQSTLKQTEQTFKDLVSASKDQLKSAAEASRLECHNITMASEALCTKRVEALEEECMKRVEAAEALCRTTVETVTAECNKRAESAESEALRCIEQADRATAAADALGKSFNVLNERLHGLEVSFRTLFAGGSPGVAPVYSPAALQTAPAPVPFYPAPQPAPTPPPPAPPANVTRLPKRIESRPNKMEFVLLGLHQKDVERIRQGLRQPTARGANIIVIEDTLKEALPKSADYAIVSGAHDLALRWKFCVEFYGAAKCVRLENGSLRTFRDKIEQLYEAKYPFHAPANLNQVGIALSEAVQRA